jgi:hypothetical protein
MNENQKQINLDELSTDQLKELYNKTLYDIGQMEVNKQVQINNLSMIGKCIQAKEQAAQPKQEEIVLPKLKKLNLNFPQVFDGNK